MKQRRKIIIDTDIGSDIDDMLALYYVSKLEEEVELIGITISGGYVKQRSKIAKKLLNYLGFENIPIGIGREIAHNNVDVLTPIQGEFGLENIILNDISAVELIKSKLEENEKVTLVGIGAFTNYRETFEKYPHLISKIDKMYLMAGFEINNERYVPSRNAHNINQDFESALKLFSFDLPIYVIDKNVSRKCFLTQENLSQFNYGDNAQKFIASSAFEWMKRSVYPVSYLYDPLTVSATLKDKCYLKYNKIGNISLSVDVDEKRFMKDFKEKMFKVN